MHEYDLIAEWYAEGRGTSTTGVPEALAMAATLRPESRILDIGCGNGLPITRALLDAGHHVVGIDTSREMLQRFRRNLPQTPVLRAAAQYIPLAAGSCDAAHMWGVMFHLPVREQRAVIAEVGRVLRHGAPFLFTSGDVGDDDDLPPHLDTMNGVTFPYYSMTLDRYRARLAEHNMTLETFTVDAGENGYFLARRR